MEDLEYIKSFSKINIKKICENKKINRGNLLNGRTTKKNMKIIRSAIESEVAKLYIESEENETKD